MYNPGLEIFVDKLRLGIIGGGQLAMMMAQESNKYKLNLNIIASDPSSNCPAQRHIDQLILGDFKDSNTLQKISAESDLMTYEIELANADVLEDLVEQGNHVYPKPQVLKIIQDKLAQSKFFDKHGLPIPRYCKVDKLQDLRQAIDMLGLPLMIKSRYDSYDGKGNLKLSCESQINEVFERFKHGKLLAQEYIKFNEEVSVVCVGSKNGKILTYPVLLNKHGQDYHILHRTLMPAPVNSDLSKQATIIASQILKLFQSIGVFTVEFLICDDQVYINEVAPRVHNSGHVTIEACDYSQFHMHLLAGLNESLPKPKMLVKHALMQNIIGPSDFKGEYEITYESQTLKDLDHFNGRLYFHLYNKLESKPYRKLGHWVLLAENQQSVSELESEADTILQRVRVTPKT